MAEFDIGPSAEKVWSIMMNCENYPRWSPLNLSIAGDAALENEAEGKGKQGF